MKSIWPKLLSFCLGISLLCGCTTDLRLSGISVSAIDFRPTSATLLETQATLTLRYTNENVVPIALSGSTHKLHLNGTYVGKSVSKEPVGMPSLNTTTQSVTIFLENLAMIQKAQALAQNQTAAFNYRLESVLYVQAGEARDSVKVVSNGQLDLSAFGSK